MYWALAEISAPSCLTGFSIRTDRKRGVQPFSHAVSDGMGMCASPLLVRRIVLLLLGGFQLPGLVPSLFSRLQWFRISPLPNPESSRGLCPQSLPGRR